MPRSSAQKLSLRSGRYDSATGRRRGFWYSWRALAAGLALALMAGSGIAVAAVASNAEAHIPTITVSCSGIYVHATYYNTDGGHTNTVTVTIGGVQQTDGNGQTSPISFGTTYEGFFPFADPTKSYAYSATIDGWDGTQYDLTKSGNSPTCAPPTIVVTPASCTVPGGTIDLTADVSALDTSHSYTIALSSPESGATNVAAVTFAPGGATGSYVWHNVVPGHTYTVTVVDTTVKLTATGSALAVGCPQDSDIKVTPTECTIDGGTGGMSVNVSGLSNGRNYTVAVLNSSNAVVNSQSITGGLTGTATVSFTVTAGASYKATITDDVTHATKTSDVVSYLPCPKTPLVPQIDPTQCTSTNGTPNSSITFSASGLVPGREYRVTVSDGKATVFDSTPFVASASTWPVGVPASKTLTEPAGTYTVTVVDTKLGSFASSNKATIGECPKLPDLAFTPTQCTVPGGTASISTTVTNFIPGRTYNVGLTLVSGGTVVVPPTPVVAPATGAWVLAPFAKLAPGQQYRVTVTDSVVPSVSAYGDVSLTVCPGMPVVALQATCSPLGASTITVALSGLEPAETYTVGVVYTSNSKPVGSVQTVAGTNPTASLQFKNVPNGNQYTVSVANATSSLTGSATIVLKSCDLPTLAFTGANPVGPAVAGIGFLQLGLMLVGLNLAVKRRKRTA